MRGSIPQCGRSQSKRKKRTGGYNHKKIDKIRSLDRAEERERVRHRVVDLC